MVDSFLAHNEETRHIDTAFMYTGNFYLNIHTFYLRRKGTYIHWTVNYTRTQRFKNIISHLLS